MEGYGSDGKKKQECRNMKYWQSGSGVIFLAAFFMVKIYIDF